MKREYNVKVIHLLLNHPQASSPHGILTIARWAYKSAARPNDPIIALIDMSIFPKIDSIFLCDSKSALHYSVQSPHSPRFVTGSFLQATVLYCTYCTYSEVALTAFPFPSFFYRPSQSTFTTASGASHFNKESRQPTFSSFDSPPTPPNCSPQPLNVLLFVQALAYRLRQLQLLFRKPQENQPLSLVLERCTARLSVCCPSIVIVIVIGKPPLRRK